MIVLVVPALMISHSTPLFRKNINSNERP
uniref:Uncharacterized protein n=1 Tax=Anguilla anguilla TaxID=7936 RepID=A0A0E9SAR6_ANGAN